MRIRSVVVAAVVALFLGISGVVGSGSPVGAGGWAVVSLDEAPVLRAGESTQIGFTVRRHGVALENPEEIAEMTVVLTGADGTFRFDVEQEGPLGHHVVTVDVPAAGGYAWTVTGPFMDVDMGRVTVAAAGAGGVSWLWTVAPIGGGIVALALGALAVVDVVAPRRRPIPTLA